MPLSNTIDVFCVLAFLVLCHLCYFVFFFFFKQKTAYEIKECDWSSDVCSSDLGDSFLNRRSDVRIISGAYILKFMRSILLELSDIADRKSVV